MSKHCVFCNCKGHKSKEHLWPRWMHRYLPLEGNGENVREVSEHKWKDQVASKQLRRQGNLVTTKFRVVCKSCNSGWMSELENEVKPLLVKILNSEKVALDKNAQNLLARWVSVKVIVGEHAESDIYVTPLVDRVLLRSENKIPEYYAIFIGCHEHQSSSSWLRISQTLAVSEEGPNPPLGKLKRNSQSITFTCGPLFVYVLAIREIGINSSEFFTLPNLIQIFPIRQQEVHIPPVNTLSDAQMSNIAWAFDDIKNAPNIKYGGDLP